MLKLSKNHSSRTEQRFVVDHFLDQLHHALVNESSQVFFQHHRKTDEKRGGKHSNQYTVSTLFPYEDVREVLKREMSELKIDDYVETIKDKKFPNKSETRIFTKVYDGKYVHIKVRLESLKTAEDTDTYHIFVMGFYFADTEIGSDHFPYKKIEVS